MAVCGHVCRDVWIPQLVWVRVNLGEGCYFNLFAREQRLFPCNINVLATAAAHWNVPQNAVYWSGTSHATRSQPFKSFDISASDVGPFSGFTTIHSMILNRQAFMDSLDFEERDSYRQWAQRSHDSALFVVDSARRSEPLLPGAMPLHSPCSLPVHDWLVTRTRTPQQFSIPMWAQAPASGGRIHMSSSQLPRTYLSRSQSRSTPKPSKAGRYPRDWVSLW